MLSLICKIAVSLLDGDLVSRSDGCDIYPWTGSVWDYDGGASEWPECTRREMGTAS